QRGGAARGSLVRWRRSWARACARGSLRAAFAHAGDAFGEGVGGEGADVAEVPELGGGVDVAAEAGFVHGLEDGFEGGLAAGVGDEAVGAGAEEADAGDGLALAPAAEHFGDGLEAAGDVGGGEVVAALGAQE